MSQHRQSSGQHAPRSATKHENGAWRNPPGGTQSRGLRYGYFQSRGERFLAPILYLVLALAFTWPLVLRVSTHVIGPFHGDNLEYVWKTWWVRHSWFEQHTSPWSAPGIGYRHPYLVSILFDAASVAWAGAALYGLHRLAWARRAVGWLGALGRETLFLYVLHHLVGFRLFYVLGWVSGRSWRGQYGVFNVPQATLLLVLLWIGMVLASRAWSWWKARPGIWPRWVRVLL